MSKRACLIPKTRESLETIKRYMPDNYHASQLEGGEIFIVGEDVAGWTLDHYIIPRLASGLIFAHEIHADDLVGLLTDQNLDNPQLVDFVGDEIQDTGIS